MTLSLEDAATMASDMRDLIIYADTALFHKTKSWEYAYRLLENAPAGVMDLFRAGGMSYAGSGFVDYQAHCAALESMIPSERAVQAAIRREVEDFLDTLDEKPMFGDAPARETVPVDWSDWLDKPIEEDGPAVLDYSYTLQRTMTLTGRKTGTWVSPSGETQTGEYEIQEHLILGTFSYPSEDGMGRRSERFWGHYGTDVEKLLSGDDVASLSREEEAAVKAAATKAWQIYTAAAASAAKLFERLHEEQPMRFPKGFAWLVKDMILDSIYNGPRY